MKRALHADESRGKLLGALTVRAGQKKTEAVRDKSFDATAPERPLETRTRELATDGRRGSIEATARFGATSKTMRGPEPDGDVRASLRARWDLECRSAAAIITAENGERTHVERKRDQVKFV